MITSPSMASSTRSTGAPPAKSHHAGTRPRSLGHCVLAMSCKAAGSCNGRATYQCFRAGSSGNRAALFWHPVPFGKILKTVRSISIAEDRYPLLTKTVRRTEPPSSRPFVRYPLLRILSNGYRTNGVGAHCLARLAVSWIQICGGRTRMGRRMMMGHLCTPSLYPDSPSPSTLNPQPHNPQPSG